MHKAMQLPSIDRAPLPIPIIHESTPSVMTSSSSLQCIHLPRQRLLFSSLKDDSFPSASMEPGKHACIVRCISGRCISCRSLYWLANICCRGRPVNPMQVIDSGHGCRSVERVIIDFCREHTIEIFLIIGCRIEQTAPSVLSHGWHGIGKSLTNAGTLKDHATPSQPLDGSIDGSYHDTRLDNR